MRKYTLPAILAALLITGSSAFAPSAPSFAVSLAAIAPNEYEVIDNYARRAPEAHTRSVKTLSAYLTAPARSEFAKVRSVYSWIMSHIRYDYATYARAFYEGYEEQYVAQILQSRRTMCTGYALLFKHLLRHAGVTAVTIVGCSRRADQQAGLPIQYADHEWNAVKIDGEWYLFDLTWASTSAQKGQPNDFYFLTDPQAFIAQHYPSDSRWQLLERPVSKSDFDRFPNYHAAYFTMGFNPYFPKQGLFRANTNVTLTLSNEESVDFWCAVGPRGGSRYAAVPCTVQHADDTYRLQVSLPAQGSQTLYVFARPHPGRGQGYTQYSSIASFSIR